MQIDDLRDYLDILEEYQEVQRIHAEVDWNLEMGAITRRVYDLGAPAALFETIKGYPKGFRALGAPLGASSRPGHGQFARTALAMHMPPSSTAKEIMSTYLQRSARCRRELPPVRPLVHRHQRRLRERQRRRRALARRRSPCRTARGWRPPAH